MAKIYKNSDHQEVLPSPKAIKCFSELGLEIIHLTLQKGESIPIHKNPFDVLFIVKSGAGKLEVEQDVFELSENELAFVPQIENRSWSNPNDQDLELIVIKMMS